MYEHVVLGSVGVNGVKASVLGVPVDLKSRVEHCVQYTYANT